jgi:hypothetical protein
LNRGDYEFLNAHWPELQHQLESRGVRLSSLSSPDSLSTPNFGHSQERAAKEKPQPDEIVPVLPLVAAKATPSRRLGPAMARGWQSWA